MKKKLLIFAWEYHGYHSINGAALSRRVRQVAENFEQNDWDVVVIYKDQRNECVNRPYRVNNDSTGIKRIAVRASEDVYKYSKIILIRKIQTLRYVSRYGDRSYLWAKDVIKYFPELGIQKPELIISFFTPRAPLFLGDYFSKKFNTPWIADLQDTFDEGISRSLKAPNISWTKKILKSATAVTHVSPEWAERDSRLLGLKINVIRHAIPTSGITKTAPDRQGQTGEFKIFYGGSLNEHHQSLTVLKNVLSSFRSFPVPLSVLVASTQVVFDLIRRELPDTVEVIHLGWLNNEDYLARIQDGNCTLVVPWSTKSRQVIPSKFYELCGLHRPVWIAGEDTGAFTFLLDEWKHRPIPFDNIDYQSKALMSAMKGDYSAMFNVEDCKGHYIKDSDLFAEFTALI